MRQYLVDLADRVTGEGQVIRILAEDTDDLSNLQEFVSLICDLKIKNPVVLSVSELKSVDTQLPEAV